MYFPQNYLVLVVCIGLIVLSELVNTTDFHFKHYSFRKKQRHAKMYNGIERDCESKSCSNVGGLERVQCTRQCVSRVCYDKLYAWDELEDGEIDVRLTSFKGCVANELHENEIKGRS